jgi:hypothetical protein
MQRFAIVLIANLQIPSCDLTGGSARVRVIKRAGVDPKRYNGERSA